MSKQSQPSPARLFTVGFVGILAVTALTFVTRSWGRPVVDLYRGDDGLFNIAHLYLFDPVIFGALASVYWLYVRWTGKRPGSTLVAFHFWVSTAFAALVIYLAYMTVDLPLPNWSAEIGPRLANQARLFVVARLLFAIAQVIFVVNLVWTSISPQRKPIDPGTSDRKLRS